MGLKDIIKKIKIQQYLKRNIYNQILEEQNDSQKEKKISQLMSLHRKVSALYKNNS